MRFFTLATWRLDVPLSLIHGILEQLADVFELDLNAVQDARQLLDDALHVAVLDGVAQLVEGVPRQLVEGTQTNVT